MDKFGKYILKEENAFPKKKEIRAAKSLIAATNFKYKILFLEEDRRPNVKTPDIKWRGLKWEIKTPTGNSSRTMENNMYHASKQSKNAVFDLRDCGRDELSCKREIMREAERRRMKHIIVIEKSGNVLLDFKK